MQTNTLLLELDAIAANLKWEWAQSAERRQGEIWAIVDRLDDKQLFEYLDEYYSDLAMDNTYVQELVRTIEKQEIKLE